MGQKDKLAQRETPAWPNYWHHSHASRGARASRKQKATQWMPPKTSDRSDLVRSKIIALCPSSIEEQESPWRKQSENSTLFLFCGEDS